MNLGIEFDENIVQGVKGQWSQPIAIRVFYLGRAGSGITFFVFGVANGDPLKLSMSVLIGNGIPAFDCAWCRCIQATSIFGAASEMLDSETIPCFVE